MNLIIAYSIAFIASFCIMVIEIVAGRILAPFVGVSLYTWTSIIGVVLAGISIGAYGGGKLADRFPERKTLGWLLVLSGIATFSIPPLTNLVTEYHFSVSVMWQILLITAIIFFVPSCILGMLLPVLVRIALQNLDRVGNVVGKIYAFSTLGSILGTFMAGFFLISWIGTRNIISSMGIMLIITAVFFGSLFKTKKSAVAFIVVPPLLIWVICNSAFKPFDIDAYFYKESNYFTIKLKKMLSSDGETWLDVLVLDRLLQSAVDTENPLHLEYGYEKIYSEFFRWWREEDAEFKSLTIGGGGYTFPRYIEVVYPHVHIDVVEIDPEVTEAAYRYLGLPRDTKIHTHNTDGRWFVMNCTSKYDVVFIDAFNDLSIPYHLTTKEFAQELKRIMNPDGVLLTNIIDNFEKGAFLSSYIRTLQEVFGTRNVYLVSVNPDAHFLGISTFIVIASNSPLDINDFNFFIKYRDDAASFVVSEEALNDFLKEKHPVVLTDDYVPVDNLLAPVFEERFDYDRRS